MRRQKRRSEKPIDSPLAAASFPVPGYAEENNKVFGRAQSFVAGSPKNMQVMIEDSKKVGRDGRLGIR
jgi:hypothetical protein